MRARTVFIILEPLIRYSISGDEELLPGSPKRVKVARSRTGADAVGDRGDGRSDGFSDAGSPQKGDGGAEEYGASREGIMPRAIRALYTDVRAREATGYQYEVRASYVER